MESDGDRGVGAGVEGEDSFGRAHVPYGEIGAAFYSKLTLGCFDVCWNARDMIEAGINALKLPADGEGRFRMADFGAADGGPEMQLVHLLKDKLPSKYELEVCFNDQPNNDFKSLFYLATGIEPLPVTSRGQCPPLTDRDGLYYSGCGRTFYDQCFPKGSVDLCTSFTAVHWLSKLPCTIDDACHHTTTKNAGVLKSFADQAEKDWTTFLKHRSAELKKGGQMVIATLARDPQGKCLGNTEEGIAVMFIELDRHWAAMRDEGLITHAEYVEATIPNYYRSEEELRKPFENGSVGLKLHKIEWRYSKCPFGRGLGSPAEVTGTVRTWSNSSFLSGLNKKRPEKERTKLVDELYNRYTASIAAEPHRHAMDYVHAYIHAEKV